MVFELADDNAEKGAVGRIQGLCRAEVASKFAIPVRYSQIR